jgi:2-phosphoxylose phosphatase
MFYELSQNFKSFQSGLDPYKLRFYVGHDGTMIRLASGNAMYNVLTRPAN